MTNNPTIDGVLVPRELAEDLLNPCADFATHDKLRALLDADHTGDSSAMVSPAKCDGNHGGPRCADPECWNDAPEVERQEPVAYLDIGVGGYLDIGSDLTDEQLSNLPKGRHALAIVGTYGVDGYTDLQSTIAQLQARIAELETNQFEGWGIDTTTGRPILVFEGCSVIEDVRAYQIIRMLKASAELESGRGEQQDGSALMKIAADLAQRHPMRKLYLVCERQRRINTDSLHEYLDECGDLLAGIALDIRKAITAQPAPIAVVLPERKPEYDAKEHPAYQRGWNACLDATAALNGVPK